MKKHIKKWGALLCAAVMFLVSVPAVPVVAAGTGYQDLDLKKYIDIILTEQGVVAKSDILDAVASEMVSIVGDGLSDLADIVTFQSTDACDRDTFSANLDAAGVTGYRKSALLEAYDIYCKDGTYSWLNKAEDFPDIATHGLKRYLVGDGVERGTIYTVDDEVVKDVCNTFQAWWSENSGYYIIRTQEFSSLDNPLLWKYRDAYNEYVTFYKERVGDGIYYFYPSGTSTTKDFFAAYIALLDASALYCTGSTVNNANYIVINRIYGLNDNWVTVKFPYHHSLMYSGGTGDEALCFANYSDETTLTLSVSYVGEMYVPMQTGANYKYLYSKEARNVKIFKSLEEAKLHSVGQQSVYYTTTYDNSVTNTVTYTGDYYCDNSTNYSYDAVQGSINQIEGDVTDSIVDSTVDQSVTNITNNYYYGSGSGDGSGDSSADDDGGGGIFDRLLDAIGGVLGDLLGLLEELVDLFLSAIVDALGVIIRGLTGAVGKLRELMTQVEGLTGFFSEFFSFVPVDVWDMVTTLMLISLVVLAIRIFKK